MTSLANSLHTWIKNELPHIPPPPAPTLQVLTEPTSTHSLWNFIVSRVHATANTQVIRANLALHDAPYTPSPHQQEQAQVDAEIAELQTEIRDLRKRLQERSKGSGVTQKQLRGAVNDALIEVTDAQMTQLSQASNLVQSVPSSHSDDDDEEPSSHLLSLLSQPFETLPTVHHLQHIQKLSHISPPLLASILTQSLHVTRSTLAPPCIPPNTPIQKARQLALDAQLRAFVEYQKAQSTQREAERKLKAVVEALDDTARLRVLGAQVAGERALLAFAKRRGESKLEGGRRVKRDVARGERVVRQLESAAEHICTMSAKMMDKCEKDLNALDVWREQLPRRVSSVVAGVVKFADQVRNALHVEYIDVTCPNAVEEEFTWERDTLRLLKLQQCREEWGLVGSALRERAQMVTETREEVMRAVYDRLVPEAEEAVMAASRCREVDAVRVRDEMRNYIVQPGKKAAPWLLQRQHSGAR